jgi:molybdopterin biosynthesis enzyme
MTTGTGQTTVDLSRARASVLYAAHFIGDEQTGIVNAWGRTLAETIQADSEIPYCDISCVDGYAARAIDTSGASDKTPRSVSILSDSALSPPKEILPGTVVRVRNGDPLPVGADTVIRLNNTYRPNGGPELLIIAECKAGENVQRTGTWVSSGEVLIEEGTLISGLEMGLLASLGRPGVVVSRKPRVAIVTTGAMATDTANNERGCIPHNGARYALVGMVLEAGSEIGRLIHVKDGRIGLERALAECAMCDATLVALGRTDRHDAALQALGNAGSVYFERVHVEPGGATAFGTVVGRPVIVMPADSVVEVFETLARPALLRMLGRSTIDRPTVIAASLSTLKLNPGYSHIIKARLCFGPDGPTVKALSGKSDDIRPWMLPNALMTIPANVDNVKRGDSVKCLALGA